MAAAESYETIDDYIARFPVATQDALRALRNCVHEVVPGAAELFNYSIPAFALVEGGKREQQIMMAGYANHVGFYPHPTTMEAFSAELTGYKTGKGSVRFPLTEALPVELIKRMIAYRKNLIDGASG